MDGASVVPILVPGVVAVLSAAISAVVALTAVISNRRSEEAARRHNRLLSVLPRRLDALEAAWSDLFEVEMSGNSARSAPEMVRRSIWMSHHLQHAYLKAISENSAPGDFARARRLLKEEVDALNNGRLPSLIESDAPEKRS